MAGQSIITTQAIYTHEHIDGRVTERTDFTITVSVPSQVAAPVQTREYLESIITIDQFDAQEFERVCDADNARAREYTQHDLKNMHNAHNGLYTYTRELEDGSTRYYVRRTSPKSLLGELLEPVVLRDCVAYYAGVFACEYEHMSAHARNNALAREIVVSTKCNVRGRATGATGAQISASNNRRHMTRKQRQNTRTRRRTHKAA